MKAPETNPAAEPVDGASSLVDPQHPVAAALSGGSATALGVVATAAVAVVIAAAIYSAFSRSDAAASDASHRVDVNHAQLAELSLLPGVGPAVGRKILDARQKSGPFKDAGDLKSRVSGIGPKLTERMSAYVEFGQ
jgi:competence ComEA-like helix-hairpin-helix protein